jgi:Flp pilus assembly protein TadG
MKLSLQMKRWLRWLAGEPRVRPATISIRDLARQDRSPDRRPDRAERGQALVVIAVAMIGLLAFVGLTVDAGILFIGEGHLRRAVDAAALAAAAQFRVNRTSDQLQQAADEVVHMNGVDPTTLVLTICKSGDSHNDDSLCPAPGAPRRKLVKVVATTHVTFAFLGIIGFPGTDITADSTTEAASVDVVLVIDTSNSMTFNVQKSDPSGLWDPYTCNAATPIDPQDVVDGYTGYCTPFHYVKKAAVDFINHLYFPYDRLSIVTFDIVPTVTIPINNNFTSSQITDWIKGKGVPGIGDGVHGLRVSYPRDVGYTNPEFTSPCTYNTVTQPDPSECTNTSSGGGLKLGGGQFGVAPIRQEAVWVVILLTDGAANASEPDAITGATNKFCQSSTWYDKVSNPPKHVYDPFCRDYDKTTRHTLLNPTVYAGIDPTHTVPYNPQNVYDPSGANYDADDYARDNADFVSCAPKLAQAAKWCRDSLNYEANQGGQGALLFGIGLGGLVIDNAQGGGVSCGVNCETRIAPSDPTAGYNAGDALLRYIANVGLDGNPDPSVGPDACQGVSPPALIPDPIDPAHNAPTLPAGNLSYNCGNYYFAQYGNGLTAVFQSIASRIFTRITQ